MTTPAKTAPRYKSGHCRLDAPDESHRRCNRTYANAECTCTCHDVLLAPAPSRHRPGQATLAAAASNRTDAAVVEARKAALIEAADAFWGDHFEGDRFSAAHVDDWLRERAAAQDPPPPPVEGADRGSEFTKTLLDADRARWLLQNPLDYADMAINPQYRVIDLQPDGALLTAIVAVDR